MLDDRTLDSVWGRSVAMLTSICHVWSSFYQSGVSGWFWHLHSFRVLYTQSTSIRTTQFVHRYSAIFIWMEFFWTVNKILFMYINGAEGQECYCVDSLESDFTTFIDWSFFERRHLEKWHFFIVASNLSLIATVLTAPPSPEMHFFQAVKWFTARTKLQCKNPFTVDLFSAWITHPLTTLRHNRIHKQLLWWRFCSKDLFFPSDSDINMSIWHSTVRDGCPESRLFCTHFYWLLRQQKLLLASVEQQPPILFLRQKHWSFCVKNSEYREVGCT